jgi:hypothetical protein
LRRLALIAVAVGMLIAAGAAYAASQINTYNATLKFTSKAAGTAKKPAPIGFTQDIKAKGTNGNRTAVLLNITTKVYGLKADGKDFPTCTTGQINAAHNDTICPKKAAVASGAITAVLGPTSNFSATAPGTAACDPALDVWNAGQGKLTFFFVDTPAHQCLNGALTTGSTPAWKATYKQQGKDLVISVPIPKAVDFPLSGLAGSLTSEHLVWKKTTTKVKGKTVAAISSSACKGKKRPYSTTMKANLPSSTGAGPGTTQSHTVSGSAACA